MILRLIYNLANRNSWFITANLLLVSEPSQYGSYLMNELKFIHQTKQQYSKQQAATITENKKKKKKKKTLLKEKAELTST